MGQEGVHVCVLDLPGRMLYVRSTIEPGGDDAINFVGSFVFIFFAQHRKVLWLSMSLLALWDSSAFVLSTVWLVRARVGMTNSWDHRRRYGKGEKLASSQFQCCRYFVEGACLGGFSLIYLHVDNGR